MVFLGGLHRSGTTLVFRLLRQHPLASGFRDTGVKEDEGQHLQTVYQPARAFGGEGRFGFRPEAHLIEPEPFAARAQAASLFAQWGRHWDLQRPVLIEKSPPNFIRMRYLQALFPDASFVILIRHPLEVALAQRKRERRRSLRSILRHWFVCHDLLTADAPHVTRLLTLRYEELLADPQPTLDRVLAFVDLPPAEEASAGEVTPAPSNRNRAQWERFTTTWYSRPYAELLVRNFEDDANRYGYSMRDLDVVAPWALKG